MDQKTRELRRRNKTTQNKRGELPEFEPKGLGRKAKSAETFPLKRCAHIEGGTIRYMRRKRPDGSTYSIPFVKGGTRCAETASYGKFCPAHSVRSGGDPQ